MDPTHLAPLYAALVSSILGPMILFWISQRATARRELDAEKRKTESEKSKESERKLELQASSEESIRKELWEEVRQLRRENVDIRRQMFDDAARCRQIERDASDLKVAVAKMEPLKDERDRCIQRMDELKRQFDELQAKHLGTISS